MKHEYQINLILKRHGFSMTAKNICHNLKLKPTEDNKRMIREVASRSLGEIISTDKGYIHISNAAISTVSHAVFRLKSQAREMNKRAKQIKEAYANYN